MIFNKIKNWILPKEIPFFEHLIQHSSQIHNIAKELKDCYISPSKKDTKQLKKLIVNSQNLYSENLKLVNSTFITPVDRESISRLHISLNWVVLSIKHLITEIEIYELNAFKRYDKMFDLIIEQMDIITKGFTCLNSKDYNSMKKSVENIIHLDNKVIKEYASILDHFFDKQNLSEAVLHKEILSQLREISKRIHYCANYIEDIIYKIN